MQPVMGRLISFIFLGIMIVVLVAGVLLLSYLLILGALVGVILFLIVWIKDRLFNNNKKKPLVPRKKSSHTIDHDDL